MTAIGQDTLKTRRTLTVEGHNYEYFSLPKAAKTLGDIARLPVSLKTLLENVLRFENGKSYTVEDAKSIAGWLVAAHSDKEVPSSRPASCCRTSPACPRSSILPPCATA
jgi:aconitate hydratase